jgi:hypothetical protein
MGSLQFVNWDVKGSGCNLTHLLIQNMPGGTEERYSFPNF